MCMFTVLIERVLYIFSLLGVIISRWDLSIVVSSVYMRISIETRSGEGNPIACSEIERICNLGDNSIVDVCWIYKIVI